ncbi:hypothetical protein HMJ29_12880 [Hymenobacter taeanensis]|uniref:Uncharacterized protein n=1 Tax=Hymenobacter taeanensis TaxID=2735321 RepID=A0A6M6BI17_9BACT|nr:MULTISPECIES: hypothetical protein [Hymenobacter]QJX47787.1 hypothetical protein HMJ29_12880 [Hymenobacter taeanensis]UOQ82725.1 hypothetical protein MUN83_08185 [Hymenobacter sp. 5414T-23]
MQALIQSEAVLPSAIGIQVVGEVAYIIDDYDSLLLYQLNAASLAAGGTGLPLMGSGATPVREQGFWLTLAKSAGYIVYPGYH